MQAELSKNTRRTLWALMGMSMLLLMLLDRTESILAQPLQTPEAFLNSVPYTVFSLFGTEVYLMQPSSSFFVHLLGALMIVFGIWFLKNAHSQRSRLNLGIGLVFWGASAILAGISYQTFGYQLKYEGREYGIFTSIFELEYLITTAFSIGFIASGAAYSFLKGKKRKGLIWFSVGFIGIYVLCLLIGTAIPVKMLITYEFFVCFMAVIFLVIFCVMIAYYRQHKDRCSRNYILVILSFAVVNAAYFLFLFSGIPEMLWSRYGIWFNANDILHVLLIMWAVQYFLMLKNTLQDAE